MGANFNNPRLYNIVVFSNSAVIVRDDPDDRKAAALEDAIGIKVIRHGVKKPAGAVEEIESHFGCKSSRLIMEPLIVRSQ
ncbi:Phosphatidylglycerophosphate phosphatase 1, chloroplastic/mitochondrial [Castilleja foliolosa]|uniref:Phosphatidylglycerophosphate phosphatase 1, chloroplastic/mitochondrial n=1 Tax=Castilleja foliolosa TaxID=1961234 RepID=A0ABD3D894_9LAMI